MKACSICSLVAAAFGIVFIILGLVLGFKVLPDYVDSEITAMTELVEGSEQYDRWVELPFGLMFKVYIFDLLNEEDVMKNNAKPNVKEHGPYTYMKYHLKQNITRSNNDNDITYKQFKWHAFNPGLSVENSDILRKFTVINMPMIAVFQIFESVLDIPSVDLSWAITALKDGYQDAFGMPPDTIYHKVTVAEYSFTGYRFCDPAEHAGNSAAKFVCALVRLMAPESMDIEEDRTVRFSFFNQKDHRTDGEYTISSGIENINTLGDILLWNQQDHTKYWNNIDENDTYDCNLVKGCDSSIYPPFNDKSDTFFIFNTDICRTVELLYKEEREYEEIPSFHYVVRENTLYNTKYPCFCIKETRTLNGTLECLEDGFVDLHTCLEAPVVLSHPHFLWADPNGVYKDTVDGLTPNEEDHAIFLDMEPNTGSPLLGGKRVQFNMVQREPNFGALFSTPYGAVEPAIMPVMWVDEGVELPYYLVNEIKDMYLSQVPLVDVVKWGFVGIGAVMFCVFIGVFLYMLKK